MPTNEYDDAPIPYCLTEKALEVAVPSNRERLIELTKHGLPGVFVREKEIADALKYKMPDVRVRRGTTILPGEANSMTRDEAVAAAGRAGFAI